MTNNGNAMCSVIFKTITVGRFVVVHLYSIFLWTPGFSLRGKFIQKITIFGNFGDYKPTFLKP